MDELVKVLTAEIKAEVQRAVEEFLKAVEMFTDLPAVSTTQELAKVLRVSDDVVRQTADGGRRRNAARSRRTRDAIRQSSDCRMDFNRQKVFLRSLRREIRQTVAAGGSRSGKL